MKQLIENLRDNRVEVSREECAAALENLTAELEATKKAVQQNYFRVVEVTAELAETRSTGLHAIGEVARLTAELDAIYQAIDSDMSDEFDAAIQGAGK